MTANELVDHIADGLNLSNPESKARIARELNVRYKQITSAIGLATTRRVPLSKNATIGNRLITFTGAEKVEAVYRLVGTRNILLREINTDEMLALPPRTEPPTKWALYNIAPSSVTVQVDCTPTTTFTLRAVGLANTTTLSNNDIPVFPESFHDILIHGVNADEYRRKEKDSFASAEEASFERRLSDLRMFVAKSAYIDIYRGKLSEPEDWWDTTGSIWREQ